LQARPIAAIRASQAVAGLAITEGRHALKMLAAGLALALLGLAAPALAQAPKTDPANTLIIELKSGKVTIELLPKLAPKHVERVKTLARQGFYDGIVFHRVIKGFMAQTGDPTGTGTGGSKLGNLPAEFTPTPFERGTVGAARANDPNSADSQFFICFTHTPFLNGKYTVWGKVVDGMPFVDQIALGEPPPAPDKMLKVYVQADGPKKK
jgi:peptidylprolyl isomerase